MASLLDLYVSIKVKDEASKQVQSISGKLGKGLKTAAKIGTAAVATAAAGVAALTKQSVKSFAEYEQLAGGAQKIFDKMDFSKIEKDAKNAYKTMNMSANEYLSIINDVGAAFSATMGDEAGYEAAKKGLQAISDYASGTGKNVNELSQKFTMITRSTSSYQSIADQFSGILPATSADFLEQAQAAGYLSTAYKTLTDVPIAEYQAAVSAMLQQGVEGLNLAGNTAAETANTVTGSLAAAQAAYSNWVTALADENANLEEQTEILINSYVAVADNILPVVGRVFEGIGAVIDEKGPELFERGATYFVEHIPNLLVLGIELALALVQGIFNGLDTLGDKASEWLNENIWSALSQKMEENYEKNREFCQALKEDAKNAGTAFVENWKTATTNASNAVQAIREKLSANAKEKIEETKASMRELVADIKAIFAFDWSLPHLKLPHVTISGSFSLNPPSVPHFGLEWYANGAILTQPTMFGLNPFTGNAMIGGEAGPEAIAPISTLQDYVSEAVNGESVFILSQILNVLIALVSGGVPMEININNTTELDGTVLARKLYTFLVDEANRRGPSLIS